MAKLFEQGKSKTVTENEPSAVSQAKSAAGANLLLQFLTTPRQGFGNYLSQGPQAPVPGAASFMNPLLAAMQNPANFTSRQTQIGTPSAPSLFQDIGGLLSTLLMIEQITGTPGGISIGPDGKITTTPAAGGWLSKGAGSLWDLLSNRFGTGDTAVAEGMKLAGTNIPTEALPGLGGPGYDQSTGVTAPTADTGNFYSNYLLSLFNNNGGY